MPHLHSRSSAAVLAAWLMAAAFAAQAQLPPAQERSATLARIAKSGTVRVGFIPTPGTFAFLDERGGATGYSIDICNRVIDNLRKTLSRPDLRTAYRPVKAAERIPLLKAGEIDIECGGNTNTVARQKEVDFSHTFFITGVRLLAPKILRAEKNDDLWQKRIAVGSGTTAETVVHRLRDEQKVRVVSVGGDPEGLQRVESGEADAFAQDDVLLYALMAGSKMRDRLAVTGRFMSVEPYAFMLPKDDPAFREIVDRTLLSLMASGELVAIYRRWFDTDRLRIPMSVYMKENIRFPNKYGIP